MFLLNVFSPQKWINNKNNQYIDGYVNLNVNLLDDFYIIPDEKNNGNGIVSTYCGYIYDVEENISEISLDKLLILLFIIFLFACLFSGCFV